ncbi:hypothetical protein GJ496_000273 [Pomphorhynchus laevis]|nr:hypothetical protein GJ496_000273 [Pomphorhynchus laevis]
MNPLSSSTAANLKDLFCPSIGLLCSADVHQILDQHGISPYQLFYQYRQLKCEVSNIKLNVRDINKSRRFMRNIQQDLLYNYIAQGNKDAFEFMCHNTLENSPHYSHEYLTQFLGCIFVVSTNNFDPIEEFRNLDQSVSWDSGDWFNEPCKFYVLLHYSTSLTNEYGNILDQMKLIYRTHNCELFVFEQIVNEDKIDLEVKVECEVEGDIIHDYIDLSACQVLNVEANVNAAQLSNGVVNFDRISTEFAQFKEAVLMRTHNYENRIDASCLFGKVQYKTNSSLKRVSISQNTHKNIGYLLEQFFFRCLLPWLDRRLRQLVEQTSTKRGVFKYITATRRSLFNVTGKVMTSESTPGSSLK